MALFQVPVGHPIVEQYSSVAGDQAGAESGLDALEGFISGPVAAGQ